MESCKRIPEKHEHNHDVIVQLDAALRCKYAANAPWLAVYGRVRACMKVIK
jgi:hypothetical protein